MVKNISSPLTEIDLAKVITFENFSKFFNSTEKDQLIALLPWVDRANLETIRMAFESVQFQQALLDFQKRLTAGVYDPREQWRFVPTRKRRREMEERRWKEKHFEEYWGAAKKAMLEDDEVQQYSNCFSFVEYESRKK